MTEPKHLFLHIGWPKTGTTTLQHFCHQNPARLAEQGLAYYAVRGECAGPIPRAIAKADPMERHRDAFVGWADHQPVPNILISSEGFAACDLGALTRFLAPARWRSITVLAYLRPQDEFIEGWYKQSVKWGGKQGLDSYLGAANPVWRLADYDTHLQRWQDWCAAQPEARLRARIFDRTQLAGGHIVQDVFDTLGLPGLREDADSSNLSPSRALIGLYLRLPPITRLQQINRAMVASGHPAVLGTRDLLTPDQRAAIRARFAESNENLRARLFPGQPQLFAPKPSPPATPEDAAEALKPLLIDTIARLRGAEVAAAARAALA